MGLLGGDCGAVMEMGLFVWFWLGWMSFFLDAKFDVTQFVLP